MGPITALFKFTIRQALTDRKIWLAVLLLAAPLTLILVIRSAAPPAELEADLWEMYHVSVQFFLMLALIPLVCMVYGTALIGADVEARTIVYLTTRRMRRATILLVKFVATALVLSVMCDLAAFGVHFCTLAGRDLPALSARFPIYANWSPAGDLAGYLMVIPLGVVSFLAVFTLIGLIAPRPLAFSVVYLVLVEMILSNIPVRARVYSLSHYVRESLAGVIPRVTSLYELPRELRDELYPTGATGLPELGIIVAVALMLCAVLITTRQLMPTKVARE